MALTWEDVVSLAGAFPGVSVATSYGTPALKVGGKLLTRLRTEDRSLVLLDVPAEERDMLIGVDPNVFHTTPHYDGYPSVLARLSSLDEATARRFIERRWRNVAPKRVLALWDAPTGPSQGVGKRRD